MEKQIKENQILQQKNFINKANDNDPTVWKQNKQKMITFLKSSPVTGVYLNEDRKQWQNFYIFYINFLNSEVGPRGECAKKIRQQLKENKQIIDQVLSPYNLDHKTHIRTIYTKFKYFTPCEQYHQYQVIKQHISKYNQNYSRINTPSHPMYISIKQGLLKKRGPDYNYLEDIQKLTIKYKQTIQKLWLQKQLVYEKLSKMKQYQNFIEMKSVMEGYFDRWVDADSGIGKESCNRGAVFQNKVLFNVLPYIFQKQRCNVFKHIKDDNIFMKQNIQQLIIEAQQNANKNRKQNKLHVFLNMKWNPRSLGEIDISIVQYIPQTQRYQALILIQCKARLFDIRQASYQVFKQHIQQDKKSQLSSKYGPVYLSPNFTSYIITTLPDYDFVLPIQSKLKQTLDKRTKDKPIEQNSLNQMKQILFNDCITKFENKMSPLDWFIKNDSDNIIMLSKEH